VREAVGFYGRVPLDQNPRAVDEFTCGAAFKLGWSVYGGRVLLSSERMDFLMGTQEMTRKLGGGTGWLTIALLLVAMQPNDFILTAGSNWIRLPGDLG
jgi:hypothetical protein